MRASEFIIERKKRSSKTGGYFFPGYGYYGNGGDTGGGGDGGGGGESQSGMATGKVKLHTDPDYFGAEVDDYQATGPVVNIATDQLTGFEPDDKMDQPASKAKVKKLVAAIQNDDQLPPLLVREYQDGYQILDGHHRFRAYKLSGAKSVPAQVVPAKDIEEIDRQDVDENFADGKRPQDKGDSARHGIPKGATMAQLQKASKAKGRKGQLARWQMNMRRGRKK